MVWSTFHSMLRSVGANERRLTSSARRHERVFKAFDALVSVSAEVEKRDVQPSRQAGGARWRDALQQLDGGAEGALPERVSVQHLARIVDTELEVSIAACCSVEELRAMRRQFAMKCHPDRFSISERALATRQMKRVNEAVDAAIQCLSRSRDLA